MDDLLAEAKARQDLVTQAINQGHAYDEMRDFREWIVEASPAYGRG